MSTRPIYFLAVKRSAEHTREKILEAARECRYLDRVNFEQAYMYYREDCEWIYFRDVNDILYSEFDVETYESGVTDLETAIKYYAERFNALCVTSGKWETEYFFAVYDLQEFDFCFFGDPVPERNDVLVKTAPKLPDLRKKELWEKILKTDFKNIAKTLNRGSYLYRYAIEGTSISSIYSDYIDSETDTMSEEWIEEIYDDMLSLFGFSYELLAAYFPDITGPDDPFYKISTFPEHEPVFPENTP